MQTKESAGGGIFALSAARQWMAPAAINKNDNIACTWQCARCQADKETQAPQCVEAFKRRYDALHAETQQMKTLFEHLDENGVSVR